MRPGRRGKGWFRKEPEVTLDSIGLDSSGWEPARHDETSRAWYTLTGDLASVSFCPVSPDLAAPLTDLATIRADFREQLAPSRGGIVEVERDEVAELAALRTIFKLPQEPTGMTYMASFILPFRDFSFVLKFQCPERGMTGVREAILLDRRMHELGGDGAAALEGWFRDPYDPGYDRPVLATLADEEKHDPLFPDHPLTRARSHLRDVHRRVDVEPAIRARTGF